MPGTASETDGEKLARLGTDAAKWVVEMHRVFLERDGAYLDPEQGELLHVWVVAMLEAGRSAGYARGRRDAEEDARRLALELTDLAARYAAPGQTLAAAEAIRRQLTGWPLPENLAASELPADSAASDLPANLAGSDALERIAEAVERLASVVAPTSSVWAAPSLRVEPLS